MSHDLGTGNSAPEGQFVDLRDQSHHPLVTSYGFSISRFEAQVSDKVYLVSRLTAAEIQNALDRASAQGGGIVRLPAGVGRIDRQIDVPSDVQLRGAGRDKTTLVYTASTGNILRINNQRNIVIRDITINANRHSRLGVSVTNAENLLFERLQVQNTARESCLGFRYAEQFTVRYCILKNSPRHGIAIKDCYEDEGVSAGTSDLCSAQYNKHKGEYGGAWTKNFTVYSNDVSACGVHGINNHGLDSEVCGNYVHNSNFGGKMFDGRNIEFHHNGIQTNKHGVMFNFTLDIPSHRTGNIRLRCNEFRDNGQFDMAFWDQYDIGYDTILLDRNQYNANGLVKNADAKASSLLVCIGSQDFKVISGPYSITSGAHCKGCENSPPPAAAACGGNLVDNGDFTQGTQSWFFEAVGDASFAVQAGVAEISVGSTLSSAQLYQEGLSLVANYEYVLEFTADADVNCSMHVSLTSGNASGGNLGVDDTLNLSAGSQQYRYAFTPQSHEYNAQLRFELSDVSQKVVHIQDVCCGRSANGPVVADFVAIPRIGFAPLVVDFYDRSVADKAITERSWLINGVAFSDVQNPTYTFDQPGQYDLALTVMTADGSDSLVKPAYVIVEREGGNGGNASLQVGRSSDDCERSPTGFLLTLAGIRTYYQTGVRFTLDQDIPVGATVVSAKLLLHTMGSSAQLPSLTIRAEDTPNALTFSNINDFDARSMTATEVLWALTDWTPNRWRETPDLASLIQLLVDKYQGLPTGVGVTLFINNEGDPANFVKFTAYDGDPTLAPRLQIEWTTNRAGKMREIAMPLALTRRLGVSA